MTAQWLVDPNVRTPSIIDAQGAAPAVRITSRETHNCLLSGFTILGARDPNSPAVLCDGSRPLISHCVMCGNMNLSDTGAIVACVASETKLINCTFTGNRLDPNGAVLRFVNSPNARVLNTMVWGNEGQGMATVSESEPNVDYCDIQGNWPERGILDLLPQFADPGSWDDRGTPEDPTDDLWALGDYHLRSSEGRLDISTETWLGDEVDSPGIDSGHPKSVWGREPEPHGRRTNMGLYGGTEQASKSLPHP